MNPASISLVLADAHLGGPADPDQATMIQFLAHWHERCDSLVLLGDFFEFLAGENRAAIAAYRPVLEQLERFAQLDYIEGNHDFDLTPGIPGLGRARIHPGPVDLLLGGLRCRLLHGDRSSPRDLGTRLLRAGLQSGPLRFARDHLLPHGTVFGFALAFARVSRSFAWPGRADEDQAARRRATQELADSRREVALFAHTHKALLQTGPAGLLANPGPARTGGGFLILAGRRVRLHRFPDGELLAESALAHSGP